MGDFGDEPLDDQEAGDEEAVAELLGGHLFGSFYKCLYLFEALLATFDLIDDVHNFLLHGAVALAVGHPEGGPVSVLPVRFLVRLVIRFRVLAQQLLALVLQEHAVVFDAHARRNLLRFLEG